MVIIVLHQAVTFVVSLILKDSSNSKKQKLSILHIRYTRYLAIRLKFRFASVDRLRKCPPFEPTRPNDTSGNSH